MEAAAALSRLLNDHGVAHAFHGNVVTAVLANGSHSDVCLTLRTDQPKQNIFTDRHDPT
jgi:hypothetical protein